MENSPDQEWDINHPHLSEAYVNLDPTVGSEIKKTRPAVVISPDEMNTFIRTVIIAPMTTKGRSYPTRIDCEFSGKHGQVVLDQIRTVDKTRLSDYSHRQTLTGYGRGF